MWNFACQKLKLFFFWLIFFMFFRIVALSVQHKISRFFTAHSSFCKLLVDSKTLCLQLPLASFLAIDNFTSNQQFGLESKKSMKQ